MKKWLATAKPGNRGESLRALQEVSKERITSVADQYFTNLCRVGTSQGRGAPSIEYRDQQKAKEACVKDFVEKYDTVTAPSGEGQAVRKEMTVQVEQWWNSSDVAAFLREENAWGADGTVAVVGKKKKKKVHDICLHTISVEFLINVCLPSCLPPPGHPERAKSWYFSLRREPC
jgi:hypothetical protein